MTKIAIVPNAAGTGTFTIEAPNSNSNRTLTLPDAAGELLTDVSSLPAANLTGDVAAARITTALNASGSPPIYAARAWVNFNGTGTVAIRASGNVSSITDNGTGDYTINFTTAMPDANYGFSVSSQGDNPPFGDSAVCIIGLTRRITNPATTTTLRIQNSTNALSPVDTPIIAVAIFR